MFEIRRGIHIAAPVDCVIFDVDGVLIDDTISYYAAVKATVRYVTGVLHGRPAPATEITDADILAFKAAGGFNDDWVLAYTLCGIILARGDGLRPDFEGIAGQSAGRGRPWVQQHLFPQVEIDLDEIRSICMEHYWGRDLFREHWGRETRHYRGDGYVRAERPLIPDGFLEQLRQLGVRHFGIITGRSSIELRAGLEMLGVWEPCPFDFIHDASEILKPDPRAMQRAIERLQPQQALYIGDTADDLQLVLNYRRAYGEIPCLAAIVARTDQREQFAAAGADIVLDRTEELVAALQKVASVSLGTGPIITT